jgi:hypothetical protein
MQRSTLARGAAVVGACAVVGAVGGIAGSAAAPSQNTTTTAPAPKGFGFGHGFRHPDMLGGGPPVHGELVVPNEAGDGFITVTTDSGTLKSVDGDKITITEGTKKATYKEATLTIPSDAKVMRNFDDAKLSDLKEGDFVHVSQSSEGTAVFAMDPNAKPPGPPHMRTGGPVRPDGPPPGYAAPASP